MSIFCLKKIDAHAFDETFLKPNTITLVRLISKRINLTIKSSKVVSKLSIPL